jgi:hypothetical protein
MEESLSRIRSIHPKLLTDEAFMDLTVNAPLGVALLIGLWMEADDQGVFEWKPLTIKARVLPAASVDINALLIELEARHFIKRYAVGGREYGAVRNFQRYQRPKKPNAVHPLPSSMVAYVGTGDTSDEESSEPVPHQDGTPSPKSPQMEEEGGKRKEEGEKDSALASDFETFWGAYPKKADKGHALKAYIAARKLGASAETLLAGAARYRADPSRDPKFTKNAQGWLSGECWNDQAAEPPPPVKFEPQAVKDAQRHMAYAAMIQRGISPGLQFTTADRNKMIAAGLVTMEQCERAGCAA